MAISHMRMTAEETAEPPEKPREAAEDARARAYLDLWERHLALVARDGPVRR